MLSSVYASQMYNSRETTAHCNLVSNQHSKVKRPQVSLLFQQDLKLGGQCPEGYVWVSGDSA